MAAHSWTQAITEPERAAVAGGVCPDMIYLIEPLD